MSIHCREIWRSSGLSWLPFFWNQTTNTAIESEDTESNADETIDPNDCVILETPQSFQCTYTSFRDTAEAICDYILSIADGDALGMGDKFQSLPYYRKLGKASRDTKCEYAYGPCLTGFLVLELMNSWDGQLFHRLLRAVSNNISLLY
ncbi:hypothetical protein HU200_059387 [Digitaria exilis]|uniref:Uncharacterized protein n=1 Tax=Digitaria exilis TaxID=1010633 RepID=A0A835AB08_9POAL|nr:hypothetical protein HU200_059387 [Digitaria exilis]